MKNYFHKSILLTFILNLAISPPICAEEVITFRHLTVENDGLSESTVYDVYKDSRGYMWISTDNGLNRYDGYSMESYQYMHYDTLSISKGAPRFISEDKKGNIIISTNAGIINKLDVETGKFKRINPIKNPKLNGIISNNSSLMLKQMPDGRFVCPVSGFLLLMDEDGRNIGEIKEVQDSTFKKEFYEQL